MLDPLFLIKNGNNGVIIQPYQPQLSEDKKMGNLRPND